MKTYSQIVDFIKNNSDFSTNAKLADKLKMPEKTLKQRKSRKSGPLKDLILLCEECHIDLNMAISGHPIEWQKNYSCDEIELMEKLIEILRGSNKNNIDAIKSNILAFWKSRNMDGEPEVESKKQIKKNAKG